MQKTVEGSLHKYTNVMTGWQSRWFILNSSSGVLQYYMPDDQNRFRPRGEMNLAGAIISPSAEDSQSFTVNSANEEVFKLRATGAKQRQFWVNRIRSVAEHHSQRSKSHIEIYPPILRDLQTSLYDIQSQHSIISQSRSLDGGGYRFRPLHTKASTSAENYRLNTCRSLSLSTTRIQRSTTAEDAFKAAQEMVIKTDKNFQELSKTIEDLPVSGQLVAQCCDTDLLLLKATSFATVISLYQCCSILQQQLSLRTASHKAKLTHDTITEDKEERDSSENSESDTSVAYRIVPDASGEVIDKEVATIPDLDYTKENKDVIFHLMSQLKLGTDLTKVVLPSFILEPHSLLEMFADFLGHANLFVRIPNASTPKLRMLAVLEWYLTSFHIGRQGALAKKPYNPLIGETFHCSWKIPRFTPDIKLKTHPKESDFIRVTYLAEQVSHHPPVSAFYVECAEKMISMEAYITPKSNFLSMSVGVTLMGEVKLKLLNLRETYTFTVPSLFVRSLLSVPWVELGGRVSIKCPSTGYSAFVTFHTKPFYGGTLHRITGEVKNDAGSVFCTITGEWDRCLQFNHITGAVKEIDVRQLTKYHKYVRPLEQQHIFESRRLWQQVTNALKMGDMTSATGYKYNLESKQREEEVRRRKEGILYQGKLFLQEGDHWIYKYPLSVTNSPS